MKKLINWFKANFICPTIFSNGHIPEPFLTETDLSIHTHRCKRCKRVLGFGHWKGVRNFHPPNSTIEQEKEWIKYLDDKENDLRRSVSKNIK